MAEQVHPRDSPRRSTSSGGTTTSVPPPGTYVVQLPKDQIYRYPPPENASRQKKLSGRKPRRSCFCRCLCWTFSLLAILSLLLAAAAGVFYLIIRPEPPKYTVDSVSINGFNVTSNSRNSSISPEFDVTVRADNPNDRIGIYYEEGSFVSLRYNDNNLCDGVLPVFYQPSNNLTIFETELRGSNVVLSSAVHKELVRLQKERKVPFKLRIKAPVKIKVGAVTTWTITIKIRCDITVDTLTAKSDIVSKECKYRVKLW